MEDSDLISAKSFGSPQHCRHRPPAAGKAYAFFLGIQYCLGIEGLHPAEQLSIKFFCLPLGVKMR